MHLTNSRSRISLLLTIAMLFFVFIMIWNPLLGLFFQIRGGYALKDLLYSNSLQKSAPYACIRQNTGNLDQEIKLKSAINSLKRVSNYNSSSSQNYLLLGRAYCLLGDYESAVAAYQKYTKIRPDNPLGYIELGFAYETLHSQDPQYHMDLLGNVEGVQPEQLRDYWQKYRDEAAVTEWLKAGITADNFLNGGIYLRRDERYDEALTMLQRALWIKIDSARAWLLVGNIYEEVGNLSKALRAYEISYFFDPEAGATELVEALDRQKDHAKIESILYTVLKDFSESDQRYQWWDTLISTLAEQERWTDVESICRQALAENPEWGDFHVDLGWALYHQNADWQVVSQEFEKAIEIDPSSPDGYFAMARLLTMENRFSEADPYYLFALERNPDNRWYQLNRATNARNAGSISLALEIFEGILVKYPQYSRGYYEIAWAYYLDGQFTKAKDSIKQAISLLDIPDEWYFARAGAIFEGAGEVVQALDYYQQALDLNPANSTALKGMARLDG